MTQMPVAIVSTMIPPRHSSTGQKGRLQHVENVFYSFQIVMGTSGPPPVSIQYLVLSLPLPLHKKMKNVDRIRQIEIFKTKGNISN